jgi:hypothetical protein
MHGVHLDRGERIVDETNVLLSKLTTIHKEDAPWLGWFVNPYPGDDGRFPKDSHSERRQK